ncbi:MAG: hypothetical protein NDI61_03365 [Bdellovibrionaceae bacterium]|nr:hypothetical protein [Pseudobdellovibrionaceae bacterium]
MTKYFGWLLGLEILGAVVAVIVFRVFESRLLAGMVAGSTFVLVGAGIVVAGVAGRIPIKSVTFALGSVHLLLVAIPMLVTRAWNADVAFDELHVLGMPGPLFHQTSTRLYSVMMIATVIEGILTWRRQRRAVN